MKVGIYIPGLGQSFVQESVEKYAARLMNEMSFTKTGVSCELKSEKIHYAENKESTVVSICEKSEQGTKIIYKIYDFQYNKILTEKYNSFSLLMKSLWLFGLVLQKIPIILKRIFIPANYNRPIQTLYMFVIFLTIASAVLLMLPAMLSLITDFFNHEVLTDFKKTFGLKDVAFISKSGMTTLAKFITSTTALVLLVIPNANVLITNMATEFVCANDYMDRGMQRQLLQGNLELLVEYISEKEKGSKIHFHAYSFGSIVAIDFIFPFGNRVSKNALNLVEALITVGTPYEFIKSYYPLFYRNRQNELGDKVFWINVYSIADALATNFRKDAKPGDSQFGIENSKTKPVNLNYEVTPVKNGFIDFLLLYSIKAHGMYWDSKIEGQSCLRLINHELNDRNIF